jgi:hypothetical protein
LLIKALLPSVTAISWSTWGIGDDGKTAVDMPQDFTERRVDVP